jgi:hypothetical protein
MQKSKSDKDNSGLLHIVTQHREKSSMVYEMEGGGALLDIRISARSTSADGGEWYVEARSGHGSDGECIAEWAMTREAALRAVGVKWRLSAAAARLPTFDWDAVARVLTAVRAL